MGDEHESISHFMESESYMNPHLERVTPDERALLDEHRLRRKREHLRAEARRESLRLTRERFYGKVWHTRDGEAIPVERMTPRHAANALPFARRQWILYQLEARVDDVEGWCQDRFDPPLVRALMMRADDQPTLRDRLVDRRNRRRWAKGRKR